MENIEVLKSKLEQAKSFVMNEKSFKIIRESEIIESVQDDCIFLGKIFEVEKEDGCKFGMGLVVFNSDKYHSIIDLFVRSEFYVERPIREQGILSWEDIRFFNKSVNVIAKQVEKNSELLGYEKCIEYAKQQMSL